MSAMRFAGTRLRVAFVALAALGALALAAPGQAAEDGADAGDVARAERIAAGKKTFRAFCWSCHGMSGRGNGPMAKDMGLPMPDFRKPEFHWDADGDGRTGSPADLRAVVAKGVPYFLPACAGETPPLRCAMPAWDEALSESQIEEVVAFVLSLAR